MEVEVLFLPVRFEAFQIVDKKQEFCEGMPQVHKNQLQDSYNYVGIFRLAVRGNALVRGDTSHFPFER